MDEPVYGIPPDLVIDDTIYAMAPANPWHLQRAIWDKIWARVDGTGIKVAVLDTGLTSHPDIPEPVATKSFISGQSITDGNGHGTHVAGTVLGRNGIGVAPGASLLVGKVLSNGGSGSSSGIAAGIRWAVDQGADIISMSLGGGGSDSGTNQALDYAVSKGVIPNTAAGNSGFNGRGNTIGWPGRYTPGTLCNAAYRSDGNIAGFSSGGNQIDWATPGQDIISASTSGGYRSMSGTSMATPFGSGLLALILHLMRREGYAQFAGLTAVREFLKQWTEDKGPVGRDPSWGWGIPRAFDIVSALVNDELKFL
jgi:subtilisin